MHAPAKKERDAKIEESGRANRAHRLEHRHRPILAREDLEGCEECIAERVKISLRWACVAVVLESGRGCGKAAVEESGCERSGAAVSDAHLGW